MSDTVIPILKLLAGPATVGVLLSVAVLVRLHVGDGWRARLWTWRLALCGFATFGIWQAAVLAVLPEGNTDLKAFLTAGRESRAGRDPYLSGGDMVALNPPPAQGVFRLVSVFSDATLAPWWSLLNALMVWALIPLANRLLARAHRDDPEHAPPALPTELAALLAASVLNSNAALRGHRWGQLCALTAFALSAALLARQRGQPLRAGAWLAVAAFKPATALPFFCLYLRKSDRRTWSALVGVSLALTALAAPPSAWPSLFRNNLTQIDAASAVGKINDYSFARDISADIIAFNQMFHRFGLRDRRVIGGLQAVAVLVVLSVLVARRNRRPFAAAASLTAVGALLVLYHRTYDAVVLALPLAYAAAVARAAIGRRRGWALAAVALLLLALDQPREALMALTAWSQSQGTAGYAVQATVLSMPTWSVVAAFIALHGCLNMKDESSAARLSHAPAVKWHANEAEAESLGRKG